MMAVRRFIGLPRLLPKTSCNDICRWYLHLDIICFPVVCFSTTPEDNAYNLSILWGSRTNYICGKLWSYSIHKEESWTVSHSSSGQSHTFYASAYIPRRYARPNTYVASSHYTSEKRNSLTAISIIRFISGTRWGLSVFLASSNFIPHYLQASRGTVYRHFVVFLEGIYVPWKACGLSSPTCLPCSTNRNGERWDCGWGRSDFARHSAMPRDHSYTSSISNTS